MGQGRDLIYYNQIQDGEHILLNGNNWVSIEGYNIYYFSIIDGEMFINIEINTYPNDPRELLNLINTIRYNEF